MWGDIVRGDIGTGGYCPGGFCPGGILSGGILSGGKLSRGILATSSWQVTGPLVQEIKVATVINFLFAFTVFIQDVASDKHTDKDSTEFRERMICALVLR